jgi:hypothetical protein
MTHSGPVYAPQRLLNLNEELDKKRKSVGEAVSRLRDTLSLDDQEHQIILSYMDRLQLRRWKHQIRFLEEEKAAPDPGVALKVQREDVPPPPLP